MRRSSGQFSGPESSLQIRSLADFITTTAESRFSVHTGTAPSMTSSMLGSARGGNRHRIAVATETGGDPRYNDPKVKIERSTEHLEWLRNRTETWRPWPLIADS